MQRQRLSILLLPVAAAREMVLVVAVVAVDLGLLLVFL
jgi:hypothetical protein